MISGLLVAAVLAAARLLWHRTRVPTALSRPVGRRSYLGAVLAESRRANVTSIDVLAPRLTTAKGNKAIQQIQEAWVDVNHRGGGEVRVLTVDADECIKAGAELLENDIEVRIARRKLQTESLSFHLFANGFVDRAIINQHHEGKNRPQPVRITGEAATPYGSHFDAEWKEARRWEAVVAEKIITSESARPPTGHDAVLRPLAEACARLSLGPHCVEKLVPHVAFRHSASVVLIIGQPGAGKSYVRRMLAQRLQEMHLEIRSLTDYPYDYQEYLYTLLKLSPPRGNGYEAHDRGAFVVRTEITLAPALGKLAAEAGGRTRPSKVTLVEFARADLVSALQEFEIARPWTQLIHVSAPDELRRERLTRRATQPELSVDGQTIRVSVSDNHRLPSPAARSLYGTDGLSELRASHGWRERIFEIYNGINDDGGQVNAKLSDLIDTVIRPYNSTSSASALRDRQLVSRA